MIYKLNEPYPIVSITSSNKEDAYLLLDLLAGIYSKASCIHLYTYNCCIFDGNVRDAFFYVKAIKNTHLELLMHCIYQYGIEPRLWTMSDDTINYWSPFYCNYNGDVLLAIKNTIDLEIQVMENTQKLISSIHDNDVLSLLKRIHQEDMLHLDIFSNLYERLVRNSLTK